LYSLDCVEVLDSDQRHCRANGEFRLLDYRASFKFLYESNAKAGKNNQGRPAHVSPLGVQCYRPTVVDGVLTV